MKLLKRKMFYRINKYEIKRGKFMKDEFCNVICMVCKKEYIVKKSVLINTDYFYVCPTCRLEEKNNIKPNHYGTTISENQSCQQR